MQVVSQPSVQLLVQLLIQAAVVVMVVVEVLELPVLRLNRLLSLPHIQWLLWVFRCP